MSSSFAHVVTDNPQRLITRLCRHWAHKFPVTLSEGHGEIALSIGQCTLEAQDGQLAVRLRAAGQEALPQLEQVVASHLQRMAGADPLPEFTWRRQG